MEDTNSFATVEFMIRDGWFSHQYERLESLLNALQEKNLITAAEHQTLLELAKKLSIDPHEE